MNTKIVKFLQWLDKKNELTCERRDLGREVSGGNHILDDTAQGRTRRQGFRASRPFTFGNGNWMQP